MLCMTTWDVKDVVGVSTFLERDTCNGWAREDGSWFGTCSLFLDAYKVSMYLHDYGASQA